MTTVNAPNEATPVAERKRGSRAASADRTKPEAIKVEVEPLVPTKDQVRHPFWIGVFPDCPIQNVYAGGQCFPFYTGTAVFDVDGKPDRPLSYGDEVELTDPQVEAVKQGVANRVLRWIGPDPDEIKDASADPKKTRKRKRRGVILMRDGNYRPQVEDVPLGRFLYMARGMRGRDFPEPMVD